MLSWTVATILSRILRNRNLGVNVSRIETNNFCDTFGEAKCRIQDHETCMVGRYEILSYYGFERCTSSQVEVPCKFSHDILR